MTIDTNELRRLAQAATPGPWYVTGKLTRYVEARIDGGLIQEVAACGPTKADGGYGPQQEANARLIAAAPDLLEALQWYEAKAVQMGRAAIDQDSKLLLELMKEIAVEYGAQPTPSVSAELLDRAIDTIGRFCSDEGWMQSDMATLDALIAAQKVKP